MSSETLMGILAVGVYALYCLYFMSYIIYIWVHPAGNWDTFHVFMPRVPLIKAAITAAVVVSIPVAWVIMMIVDA